MHGPVSSLLYVERSGSLWGDFEKYKKAFLNYFKVSVTFLNVGTLLKKSCCNKQTEVTLLHV